MISSGKVSLTELALMRLKKNPSEPADEFAHRTSTSLISVNVQFNRIVIGHYQHL